MKSLEASFLFLLPGAHPTLAVQGREVEVVGEERGFAHRVIDVVWVELREGEVFQAIVNDGLGYL